MIRVRRSLYEGGRARMKDRLWRQTERKRYVHIQVAHSRTLSEMEIGDALGVKGNMVGNGMKEIQAKGLESPVCRCMGVVGTAKANVRRKALTPMLCCLGKDCFWLVSS